MAFIEAYSEPDPSLQLHKVHMHSRRAHGAQVVAAPYSSLPPLPADDCIAVRGGCAVRGRTWLEAAVQLLLGSLIVVGGLWLSHVVLADPAF